MENALAMIHNEKKSIPAVAEAYSIIKSTLHGHSLGKVERGRRRGPLPVLTAAEEQKLVNWALEMVRISYSRTREQI